jgi:acyl-CoA reductase-like NAD-dependent aldehyde dehydrogenase
MTFKYQQHIDGAWTGAANGGMWEVINPATEDSV